MQRCGHVVVIAMTVYRGGNFIHVSRDQPMAQELTKYKGQPSAAPGAESRPDLGVTTVAPGHMRGDSLHPRRSLLPLR